MIMDKNELETKTFIVIATFTKPRFEAFKINDSYYDSWTTHEDYADAHDQYTKNRERDDYYTTSICNVVTSTDYDV